MDMEIVSPWKCANGHVLGVVVRTSSRVNCLLLYRQAVGAEDEAEVDVLAMVVGMVRGVRCSICGAERTWMA